MPRVSETVDDTTPLAAPRIDIPARIGWLLRTNRTVGGLSLRQMSGALQDRGVHLSSTTLGRIESTGQRSPAALDGYAAVLGLPDGGLRASVDSMCRAFAYAPPVHPEPATRSLDDFSAAVEAVMQDRPTGGAWMRFARQHADDNGFGLPVATMGPLVQQLVEELLRSTTTAHVTRYGALVDLLDTAYGPLVESTICAMVLTPGTPRVDWLTSALSDRPTAPLLRWCADLLAHASVPVMEAGSYALQSMLVSSRLSAADWDALIPAFDHAWHDGAAAEGARRQALTHLARALPAPLRAAVARTCRVAAEPVPAPRNWARGRDNAQYTSACSTASVVCRRMSHPDEPLLERVLFEAIFDPRGVRKVIGRFQLLASPFAEPAVEAMLESADRAPHADDRRAVLHAAAFLHRGQPVPGIEGLLASPDEHDFLAGLSLAGQSGLVLPGEAVARGLAGDPACVRRTLLALSYTRDRRLEELAHTGEDTEIRAGARWWREHGGRVDS